MARWIAIFENVDETVSRPIREAQAQSHFDFLSEHSAEIVVCGGLRESDEAWYCGGMWVLEVMDRRRAQELCEADPYFRIGLRKGYRLYRWGKASCYGQVTL